MINGAFFCLGSKNLSDNLKLIILLAGIALNVTAKEFVPNSIKNLSSPKLCPSVKTLKVSQINSVCDTNIENLSGKCPTVKQTNKSNPNSQVIERKCVRCKKTFQTDAEGFHLELEECRYHWGKLRRSGERQQVLSCCGVTARERRPAGGCCSASAHVWSGLPQSPGILGPMSGYVKSKHRKTYPAHGNFGVYGLDCEMVYTRLGLQLVKVSNSVRHSPVSLYCCRSPWWVSTAGWSTRVWSALNMTSLTSTLASPG